jgi:hypothetical protein
MIRRYIIWRNSRACDELFRHIVNRANVAPRGPADDTTFASHPNQPAVRDLLVRDGVLARIGEGNTHGNVDHAVAAQMAVPHGAVAWAVGDLPAAGRPDEQDDRRGRRSCVDDVPSDEELTVRAQSGDSAALGLLLARYQGDMRAVAWLCSGSARTRTMPFRTPA